MADSQKSRSPQIHPITQHVNLAIRSKQSEPNQVDVHHPEHECASDDSSDLQSNESVADDAEPRRAPGKGFLDLPGEIRNEIYRLICARNPVDISFKDVGDEIPTMFLDDYAVSRPLAMLRVNPQISQEFFGIFSPPILFPEKNFYCPGPFRHYDVCALDADFRVRLLEEDEADEDDEDDDEDDDDEQYFPSRDIAVEARYTRDVRFQFDFWLSLDLDLTQDCIDSVLDILRDALANTSNPMLLNFLVATDRILTMPNSALYVLSERPRSRCRSFGAGFVRGNRSDISDESHRW